MSAFFGRRFSLLARLLMAGTAALVVAGVVLVVVAVRQDAMNARSGMAARVAAAHELPPRAAHLYGSWARAFCRGQNPDLCQ